MIFHGAIAFYQTDSSILALIADLGSDHQYLAGSWLAEQELERGSVHALTGVATTGKDKFKYPIFAKADVDCTGHHCDAMGSMGMGNAPYAILQFPLPEKAMGMFEVVIRDGSIQGVNGDVRIPFTPVLQYTISGKPRLGSHWPGDGIDPSSEADLPYRTLHVFAENPVPLGIFRQAHVSTAFGRACGLLSQTASFTDKLSVALPDPLPCLPCGLEDRIFEFQPLGQRIQALHQIGLSKQECPDRIYDPWKDRPSIKEAYCQYFNVGCPPSPLLGDDITCIPATASGGSN
ncbi:MAG TPA: hypothetical protein VKX45_10015 [Bryobacteraceae bacterium]|nr:hypothetical protein [Bryobacteraceae bacterium]